MTSPDHALADRIAAEADRHAAHACTRTGTFCPVDTAAQDARRAAHLAMALTSPWFAVRNGFSGGWTIATADIPVDEIYAHGDRVALVADLLDETLARHVAGLHNAHLAAVAE